jgi:PST family polysaccharide transporter
MATGAAWLVLFKLTERSIGFVSTLILARLLVPDDFGLVAMATSILAALDLLGAFSFDLALIQNQNAARYHYDTAWTFAVLFGILKAAVLCTLAMPAASFFGEARLPPLIFALAVYTFLEGFDNVGTVAFQKDLELHKEFRFGLLKKLVGFVVTISVAFWLRSYWALIAGILSTRLASLVLSYVLHPFRPKFSLAGAGDLFGFSKWLLLNNLLIFVNNRGTDFVIGKLAGARALGLYSVSYEIANLPTTELVWPISRAVFPGYARMANDPPRLREAFLQVIGLVAIFTVPAGAIIAIAAEPIVQVLLGSKWSDAVPLIQVLAVFGIIRSLHGPTGSIYLALGKPRFVAGFQCVQLTVAIGLMFVLLPAYGTVGAAYALLAGASAAMVSNYVFAMRELKLSMSELTRALWRPIASAAAMIGVVLAVGPLWAGDNAPATNVLRLSVLLATAALVYVVVVVLCWCVARRPEGPESQIVRLGASRLGLRTGT